MKPSRPSDAIDLPVEMPTIGRALALLNKVNRFETEALCLDYVASLSQGARVVSFLNAHAFNLAHDRDDFRDWLLAADVLLRDGVGIEMLMRIMRADPGINSNGTDFIPKLLAACPNARVAVFGTVEPWLSAACRVIEAQGVSVVARKDGFQNASVYVDCVRECAPDLVILGMGMPKQEMVAAELAHLAEQSCLIVNGGAVLDFLAERFSRAPVLVRTMRLEWLYRLVLEPARLWRRYLLGGLIFLCHAIQIVWLSRKLASSDGHLSPGTNEGAA